MAVPHRTAGLSAELEARLDAIGTAPLRKRELLALGDDTLDVSTSACVWTTLTAQPSCRSLRP